jgi:hypothetical protein
MSMSTTGNRPQAQVIPSTIEPSRYDLLLAVIPTALLVGVGASYLTLLPPLAGLGGASLIGVFILTEALFRNPPPSE